MGTKVQQSLGPEILSKKTVKGRKSVGGGIAALKEQPHRVALVAKARLNRHSDIAELCAKDKKLGPVRQLAPWRGAPGLLQRFEMGLLLKIALHGNLRPHIGIGAVERSITF